MADFSYLNSLDVKNEVTAELILHWIVLPNGKSPSLIGRHAGQSNKPYYNAVFKTGIKQTKAMRKNRLTPEMTDENRDEDRVLYPKFVITGWNEMVDSNAQPVAFSQAECESFFKQLPDHIFDEVRDFFADVSNFTNVLDMEVVEETGND